MKKIKITAVLLILLLAGCTQQPEQTTTTEKTTYITTTTTTTPMSTTTTTTSTTTTTTVAETTTTTANIPFFGIEEDFIQENDLISLTTKDLQELGAGIARTHGGPFVWDFVEPEKGKIDYKLTDKAVKEAADADITILASLWSYTMWDQGHLEECRVGGEIDAVRNRIPDYRCKPQDMQAHNRFLKDMVERYDGDENYGTQPISEEMKTKIRQNPVIYWEINNEVDVGDNIHTAKFFQGTIGEYVELLKESYTTIKEACPHCQVLIAAPATETGDYYQEIFSLDGGEYFDVYNLHQPIDELKKGLRTIDKPVIITEAGGQSGSELAKGAIRLAGDGVSSAMITMTPDRAKMESGGDKKKMEGFLLNSEGEKTKTYYSFQAVARELSGFTKAEKTREGRIECVRFSFSDKKPVEACYLDKGASETTLELEEMREVTDLWGDKQTTKKLDMEEDNVYFIHEKT